MARVLLTGSYGFIGRHVHRHLVAAGHQVIPFDRAADPAQTLLALQVPAAGGSD